MGSIDIESKKYFSNNEIFADAFNFKMFDGKQVILPEQLQPVDTTEIIVPYGNNAKFPVERHRDIMKIWAAKEDGRAVYVLLGEEIQADIHYAMPVRSMLYDSITYAKQVDAARRSYRNQKDTGDVVYEEGQVKIRLTSEEFLSGFRKEDKLIPNYRINLIAPFDIGKDDADKFHTDLGLALLVLKYQNDESIVDIIRNTNHRRIDRNTAEFLNVVADLKLEYKDSEEEGSICVKEWRNTQEELWRKEERKE